MTEREIRFNEMDVLEKHLDLHGVHNQTLRSYLKQRRGQIDAEFPEPVPEPEPVADEKQESVDYGAGQQAGDTKEGEDARDSQEQSEVAPRTQSEQF